ncbi:MAG: antitoxin [Burkholderiales bacterium]
MSTAKVFKSGNSQAVRLSKEFQFDTREVEIFHRGDEVVLCSRVKTTADVVSILSRLSPDFMEHGRDQGPSQVREEL